MQCLFLLNITLKNNRLYLLTALALHTEATQTDSKRHRGDDGGGRGGRGRTGEPEKAGDNR